MDSVISSPVVSVTQNKIAVCTTPSKSSRTVYDFQVEDNENVFVRTAPGKYQLAHNCLLKPLEEPSPDTLWILCSMDPQKFGSGNGKAIANRCAPFVLEPHTNADLYKQGVRIVKGERIKYIDRELLKEIVRASNSQMRNLANLIQAMREYYDGLEDRPSALTAEHIASVLSSTESQDDKMAVEIIIAIFGGQYAQAQKALLNVADGFKLMQTLLWISGFLLNVAVLQGARHSKVWWNPTNKAALEGVKQFKPTLGQYAAVQAHLVELKARAQAFAVGETELISATIYRIIKDIHTKKE